VLQKLGFFPSSDEMVKAPTLLGLVESANLNHWTACVNVNASINAPEFEFCQQDITGKFTIKIVEVLLYTVELGYNVIKGT
jgi:hypothetical protein